MLNIYFGKDDFKIRIKNTNKIVNSVIIMKGVQHIEVSNRDAKFKFDLYEISQS